MALKIVGSSPITHPIKEKHPLWVLFFYGVDGTRRERPAIGRAKKCPVDTFLARGRVPCASERTRMGVGGSAESGRSWVMGLERPAAAFAAVKTVRWTVFRPWESPAPQGASSSKPPQRTVFLLWDGWAWSRAARPSGGQKSVRWTLFARGSVPLRGSTAFPGRIVFIPGEHH